jgi:SAM-dependent methyltransferase
METSEVEAWLESGLFLVDLLARTIGQDDLSETDLLDVGSGRLIVKTLLDRSLPIAHYSGLDGDPEVIESLRSSVSDPKFEFHHLDVHNALYNPDGKRLEQFDLLPVGPRRFDLISLFSFFTHLAPADYVGMLQLLRRHVTPDGTLIFSLLIIDAAHPSPWEQAIRHHLNHDDPRVRARAAAAVDRALQRSAREGQDPRFVDEIPGRPLERARYTRDYAIELVEGTGWEIEAIHPPHPKGYIQHYMVCRPV